MRITGFETFDEKSLISLCDLLASNHQVFKHIIRQHGYPPFWSRTASFETLIHIILEQQVSLASALAAFNKLKQVLPAVTPENFLLLSDETLRSCYFSRQKITYTKHLATLIANRNITLEGLEMLADDAVANELQKVKGIGKWTANIYLMMCLHRRNIFPLNDIALISSIRQQLQLPLSTTKEEMAIIIEKWAPCKTIAAYLLWHAYLCRRAR